jgi:hypothetical protein
MVLLYEVSDLRRHFRPIPAHEEERPQSPVQVLPDRRIGIRFKLRHLDTLRVTEQSSSVRVTQRRSDPITFRPYDDDVKMTLHDLNLHPGQGPRSPAWGWKRYVLIEILGSSRR